MGGLVRNYASEGRVFEAFAYYDGDKKLVADADLGTTLRFVEPYFDEGGKGAVAQWENTVEAAKGSAHECLLPCSQNAWRHKFPLPSEWKLFTRCN